MGKLIFPDIHISISEYACLCCNGLPPQLKTDRHYYQFFLKWEALRTAWGRPIKISKGGGWRCPRYQYQLIMNRKTRATCSPHFFFALDNDFNTEQECQDFATLIEEMFPFMRIGYLGYLNAGKTFVHLDEAYLVKPKPSPTWIEGYRW